MLCSKEKELAKELSNIDEIEIVLMQTVQKEKFHTQQMTKKNEN